MTEKLYYKSAYISEFKAKVASVTEIDGAFDVILDKTAFFPNEGGQSEDGGFIGDSRVVKVVEKDGVIHHFCNTPPTVGDVLDCKIDFEERFEKMQCHTAEHLLCGIIHSLFGFENVGFHLSDDAVVFDVNGYLSQDDVKKVLSLANRAVFENRPVKAYFPESAALQNLEYRSKSEILGAVRIVEIDGYDTCACCAPHVSYTGEIGIISIFNFEKHRGGTRIYMLAGARAERDYVDRIEISRRISALTSEPQKTIDRAVERLYGENEELKQFVKAALLREAELRADALAPTDKNAVVYIPHFDIPSLIAFSNSAGKKIGGILVALCGENGDFKYVISSKSTDLKVAAKEINTALSGRGGGKPEMIQGSFSAALEQIKEYFA